MQYFHARATKRDLSETSRYFLFVMILKGF